MAELLSLVIQATDQATPALEKFAKSSQAAEQASKRLADVVAQGSKQASQQVTALAQEGQKASSTLERLGQGFAQGFGIGTGAAVIGTAISTVAGAVTGAVRSMAGFETALASVGTLGGITASQQARLRGELLQLPPILGSSTTLAKGLYDVLGAGIAPAQAVAVVGEAARLASAGLTTMDAATNIITKSLNAYGLQAKDAGKISDTLFRAVDVGVGTVEQFAHALPNVLNISKQLGLTFQESATAVATLSKTFPSASEAAHGFRSFLANVIQNVDKFAAVGINAQKVLGEEGLVGLLKRMRDATGGNIEALRTLVPDVEGLSAAAALTGTSLNALGEDLRKVEQSAGATSNALAVQADTLGKKWDTFINSLDRNIQRVQPVVTGFLKEILSVTNLVVTGLEKDAVAIGAYFSGQASGLDKVRSAWSQYTDVVQKSAGERARAATSVATEADLFEEISAAQREAIDGSLAYGAAVKKQQEAQANAIIEAEKLRKAIVTIGEASKQIPLDTEANNKKLVASFVSAFKTIQDSGKVAPEQVQKQWENVAKRIKEVYGDEVPAEFANANRRLVAEAADAALKAGQAQQGITDAATRASGGTLTVWRNGVQRVIEIWRSSVEPINASQQAIVAGAGRSNDQILTDTQKVIQQLQASWLGYQGAVARGAEQSAQRVSDAYEGAAQRSIASLTSATNAARSAQINEALTQAFGGNRGVADNLNDVAQQIRDVERELADLPLSPGAQFKGFVESQSKVLNEFLRKLRERYDQLAGAADKANEAQNGALTAPPGAGGGINLPTNVGGGGSSGFSGGAAGPGGDVAELDRQIAAASIAAQMGKPGAVDQLNALIRERQRLLDAQSPVLGTSVATPGTTTTVAPPGQATRPPVSGIRPADQPFNNSPVFGITQPSFGQNRAASSNINVNVALSGATGDVARRIVQELAPALREANRRGELTY